MEPGGEEAATAQADANQKVVDDGDEHPPELELGSPGESPGGSPGKKPREDSAAAKELYNMSFEA